MRESVLTLESWDGVASALTGNGELCTTLGPHGFHISPKEWRDPAHRTQCFVLAGRRRRGSRHPLLNLGSLTRRLMIDGAPAQPESWSQQIDYETAEVRSTSRFGPVRDTVRSAVLLSRNAFAVSIHLRSEAEEEHAVEMAIDYCFGESEGDLRFEPSGGESAKLHIEIDDTPLIVAAGAEVLRGSIALSAAARDRGLTLIARGTIRPGPGLRLRAWVHFSDRITYEEPITSAGALDEAAREHEEAWRRFAERSAVETGTPVVDEFRRSTLYTLRCQATPWSIPPSLSEPYWGAGTFHDEMYPFLGLLSSNHREAAERVPYFRLTTLPQAVQRARGRGALYPWSSTENGEERDPVGLWLTERFHLGQFAVCVWMLWLFERDRSQLADLYPVLREVARYFELNMMERDNRGRLRTKACVDFDESVGAVTNGPFTICAAIAGLEAAARAAEELERDAERAPRWRSLAAELRQNLPCAGAEADTAAECEGPGECDSPAAASGSLKQGGASHFRVMDADRPPATPASPEEPGEANGRPVYAIPNGKPLHYSILGPIFPFRVDVDSERARNSAALIHRACRSSRGWKPGFSEGFEGSNWMWTAGHLGVAHALQGNGDLAWEAIAAGPESAGPLLSPNEHVDREGRIHVPWFTTGCGGWLYALNCLFVQVDEEGTRLLPAVPSALPNARFRDLRAEAGVLVSGEFAEGRLVSLTARAPAPMAWRYRIPAAYVKNDFAIGRSRPSSPGWISVRIERLDCGPTPLLAL